MLIEKFAPGLADWLHDRPQWGILASAGGFVTSFMSFLSAATPIIGFFGALFGLCAGYYTFRIKRQHWHKIQHKEHEKD